MGDISDCRLYQAALTSNQVYNLYNGINPTNKPVLWLPMDRAGEISYSQDSHHRKLETFGNPKQGELSR